MSDKSDTKQELNEINNDEEFKKIILDMDTLKFCKTDILQKVKFETGIDKFVFDSLPLSNSQKEELLLSIYKEKNI